ncbi:MAG: hypothetical protein M1503_00840 [Thaumarchaeota archaeon]|nr:hypothetical protein [Nitrososphaerota archaeon]MCL5316800.1 hypothetical protein [Nitrososphaerota archaeon]
MKSRFIVDGMLGSLARKLRIFGYDTLYKADLSDNEILEAASGEGRTILTSDQKLADRASKRRINCILLNDESNDEARLATVLRETGEEAAHLNPEETRCSVCNGEVEPVGRDEVAGAVPEGVLAKQEKFYRCKSCGKIYWIGGHWKRLNELSANLKSNHQNNNSKKPTSQHNQPTTAI